jgi:hypothetical protein
MRLVTVALLAAAVICMMSLGAPKVIGKCCDA